MLELDRVRYSPSPEEVEVFSYMNDSFDAGSGLKKKGSKNSKKRFSDEQIQSLESIFEFESRLEPRKKLQLAKELGLQPRQVAIWFQNKRARWKSKNLERDYNILKANYNNLASRFEALKKEKQALVTQLNHIGVDRRSPEIKALCSVPAWQAGKSSISLRQGRVEAVFTRAESVPYIEACFGASKSFFYSPKLPGFRIQPPKCRDRVRFRSYGF